MMLLDSTRSPALLHDDDEALFERWREAHDERAREILLGRYLPLARKLAMRYVRSSEPLDDLIQVANLGLLKAMERFDTDRPHRFASFAVPTILGELRRYFRDCGWMVKVPRGTQERAMQVERAERELTARHGRSPTAHQLAEYTELDLDEVLEALQAARVYEALSLDAPRSGGDVDDIEPLVDSLGGEDASFSLVEEASSVSDGLGQLTRRERHILYLRFAEDLTQSEIASRVGVSQMQISRTLRRTLEKLRAFADGDPVPRR